MQKRLTPLTIRRITLAGVGLAVALTLAISVADAFTGPSNSGGVGSGAIATDAQNNIGVGTSTANSATKLYVQSSSTASTSYAFKVAQPGGTVLFSVANDGTLSLPGYSSTLAAANVSSGSFGSNTGGGTYTFPGQVNLYASSIQGYTSGSGTDAIKVVGSSIGSVLGVQNTNSGGWSGLEYIDSGGTKQAFIGFNNNNNQEFKLDNQASGGYMYLRVGGSTRIYIANGGNVGIGTTTPSQTLHVDGTVYSSSGGFKFPDGTTQTTASTGGSSSTISAANVSAGSFGANTGGGNYTFPALVYTATGTAALPGIAASADTDTGLFWGGSNILNFTTGANQRMTILANGNVGIGTASPGKPLDVNGQIQFKGDTRQGIVREYTASTGDMFGMEQASAGQTGQGGAALRLFTSAVGNAFISFGKYTNATTFTDWMTISKDGYVGIRNASPSYYLDVASNGGNTARIGTSSGDTLTVGGGSGKLNVGTIDPIYQIGGEKFATYVPGIIGVKEEVAGVLEIPCSKGTCEKTIDFSKEPHGSDLWLFGKVTDIGKHLPKASIMLTPAFDGRVSYRKDHGTLTIAASTFEPADSVEVSYRFTAPRFDADKWTNRTNDEAAGFVID